MHSETSALVLPIYDELTEERDVLLVQDIINGSKGAVFDRHVRKFEEFLGQITAMNASLWKEDL